MTKQVNRGTISDFKDSDGKWVRSISKNYVRKYSMSGRRFEGMMSRCKEGGAVQAAEETYIGCSTSENFKDFQFFTDWSCNQIGYEQHGWELDKDLLFEGNKIYSENNCVFIPKQLNTFISISVNCMEFPLGVSLYGKRAKFRSRCNGKFLGHFSSRLEAHKVYVIEKERQARVWYERCKSGEVIVDPRVTERLRTWTVPEKYLMPELLAERRNSML